MRKLTVRLSAALVALAAGALSAQAGPLDVADLRLWLRADAIDGLSDGDPVATWPDSGPDDNDATQATGARQPSYLASAPALGGLPAVRFGADGGQDWLDYDGSFLVTSDYTLFVLEGRSSSKSDNYFTGGTLQAANSNLILGYRTNTVFTLAQYHNDINVGVGGYSGQEFVIDGFQSAGTAGKAIYRDGALAASSANTTLLAAYPGAAVGGRFRAYEGDIAEVLMYDRALSQGERNEVGSYLERKYGRETAYVSSAFGQHVLSDGARIYLRLNEAAGAATAGDLATDDGTQNGIYRANPSLGHPGIPFDAPEGDTSGRFDGLNDYIEIAETPSGNYAAYTIEAWVKLDDTDNQGVFVRTAGSNLALHSHELWLKNGVFEHRLWDGSEKLVTGTTQAEAGKWYHLVATAADQEAMKLYVNGVEEGTPTAIGGMWKGGNQWFLGSHVPAGGVGYLDGILDEVAVYDRVLSAEEIFAHYQAGIPEPASLALLGAGLLVLARRRRKA